MISLCFHTLCCIAVLQLMLLIFQLQTELASGTAFDATAQQVAALLNTLQGKTGAGKQARVQGWGREFGE